ncbi:MAG: hypothetical protein ACK5HO_04825 [Pseudomonadota bacterium]
MIPCYPSHDGIGGIVGYWRVFDPSVQPLVISRRDKGIGSGCFRAPYESPGVPKGIKNGGADGCLTKSIRKPGRNPKTIHSYRFARFGTHRAECLGGYSQRREDNRRLEGVPVALSKSGSHRAQLLQYLRGGGVTYDNTNINVVDATDPMRAFTG